MTHPVHPCPPNNPHCGGQTQPPNPGGVKAPNAIINGGTVWLLILAIMLIIGCSMFKKRKS